MITTLSLATNSIRNSDYLENAQETTESYTLLGT